MDSARCEAGRFSLVNLCGVSGRIAKDKNEKYMKWLTIDAIKQQLRLDYDCEDALLELHATAVENVILRYCRRTYEEFIKEYGEIPPEIRLVSLLLCEHLYNHRGVTETVPMSAVPYAFDYFMKPFMRLSGDDNDTQE